MNQLPVEEKNHNVYSVPLLQCTCNTKFVAFKYKYYILPFIYFFCVCFTWANVDGVLLTKFGYSAFIYLFFISLILPMDICAFCTVICKQAGIISHRAHIIYFANFELSLMNHSRNASCRRTGQCQHASAAMLLQSLQRNVFPPFHWATSDLNYEKNWPRPVMTFKTYRFPNFLKDTLERR